MSRRDLGLRAMRLVDIVGGTAGQCSTRVKASSANSVATQRPAGKKRGDVAGTIKRCLCCVHGVAALFAPRIV